MVTAKYTAGELNQESNYGHFIIKNPRYDSCHTSAVDRRDHLQPQH
ncbi:hypothetical protein VCRA2133E348_10180 [Vibrio crassostreae]|nr:hypothetical protein VCRA2133E348_10180 [Vibrio crassostreae]CAK3352669.1 hypothetical protein VCRA213O314_20181 [Vibrio crassostreae]